MLQLDIQGRDVRTLFFKLSQKQTKIIFIDKSRAALGGVQVEPLKIKAL